METDSTRTIDDLIEKIVESPGKYNADMIISLALALTRSKSGKTRVRVENAREKVIATNRLSTIQFSNTEMSEDALSVTLQGGHFSLGNASSPLPSELFDEITKQFKDGSRSTLEFLDIFVDRLTHLDFSSRQKLAQYVRPHDWLNSSVCKISKNVATIQENFHPMPKHCNFLKFEKLKNYSFRKPLSAIVFKRILENLLGCDVYIKQNRLRFLCIPQHLRCKLPTYGLGKGTYIGKYLAKTSFGLDVEIKNLSPGEVDSILEEPTVQKNMCVLLRALFDFPLSLKITFIRSKGKSLSLGKKTILGRNSWLSPGASGFQPVTIQISPWSEAGGR